MKIEWRPTTMDAYWQALEALPPAARMSGGFLLGEPYSDRTCSVSGKRAATFHAYAEVNNLYFKAAQPLTVAEFIEAARTGFATARNHTTGEQTDA